MPNKKKNQNKGKKKKTQKVKKQSGSSGPKGSGQIMASMMLAHKVCSVTNPFCPQAHGAKWPDGQFTRSATFDIDGASQSMVTTVNGDHSYLFFPNIKAQYVAANTVSAGSITFAGGSDAFATIVAPPSGIARYRLTSWGIRLSCNTSPMSVSGVCRVRLYSPLRGAALAALSNISTNCDESLDIPLSRLVNKDYYVLSKPIGTGAREFRDLAYETSLLSTWSNPGWQVIGVGIAGAPGSSSEAMVVTVYYHWEVVFDDGQSASVFTTAPPPPNPVVVGTAAGVLSGIGNFIEGAAEKVDGLFKSKAVKLLASAVATQFGGPAAGSNTYMLMDGKMVD